MGCQDFARVRLNFMESFFMGQCNEKPVIVTYKSVADCSCTPTSTDKDILLFCIKLYLDVRCLKRESSVFGIRFKGHKFEARHANCKM